MSDQERKLQRSMNSTRRKFLGVATATTLGLTNGLRAATRGNAKIKVALIGCGGRAGSHRDEFQKLAQIAWVCDPDKKRLADFENATGAKGTTDMRRVFDDREVQAVVISTPDHWHVRPLWLVTQESTSMLRSLVAIVLRKARCSLRQQGRTR